MCGEKLSNPPMNCSAMGSPPHMRGKDHRLFVNHRFLRITPAHAGKSCWMRRIVADSGDHPRTCGEKCPIVGIILTEHRITPAHAGKRWCLSGWSAPPEDHPRMCGEKRAEFVFSSALVGSPPRMRGKEELARAVDSITGITPACAGKSKTFLGPADSCEDHPRMCGEKLAVENKVNEPQGSPPHVRGKVRG